MLCRSAKRKLDQAIAPGTLPASVSASAGGASGRTGVVVTRKLREENFPSLDSTYLKVALAASLRRRFAIRAARKVHRDVRENMPRDDRVRFDLKFDGVIISAGRKLRLIAFQRRRTGQTGREPDAMERIKIRVRRAFPRGYCVISRGKGRSRRPSCRGSSALRRAVRAREGGSVWIPRMRARWQTTHPPRAEAAGSPQPGAASAPSAVLYVAGCP